MFAVFESGGSQYRVEKGTVLEVEKIDAKLGSNIIFDNILLVGAGKDVKIGSPFVKKASVKAEVLEETKGKKIRIIKLRRRKHSMQRMGHRQKYTKLKVSEIKA